jgi:2-dehydropantoate 2-reductase
MKEVRVEYGRQREDGEPSVYEVSDSMEGQVKPHEAAHIFRDQDKNKVETKAQSTSEEPIEYYKPFSHGKGDYAVSEDPIHNLIITTKTPTTVSALRALKTRLLPTSTLCFLQNGMGVIDDVNEHLFPDPAQRPNYMQGIITHGANVPPQKAEQDPFYAVHAGKGTIALGLLPREGPSAVRPDDEAEDVKDIKDEKWAPSSRYLLRTLARSPVLCAIGFTPTELLQQQLEKLVVNSVLNPLTAILDNKNGSILYNFPLTRTMRLMLAETSHVIRNLPELKDVPNVTTRFGPQRLEDLVVSVTKKTADNISSMLADVRAGRRTEIEYINGYIVKRGEELGLKCLVNYAIMQTVMGKALMTRREVHGEVPVEGEGNTGSNLSGDS